MVTRDQMARIALRHDTTMSLAMLRALGVTARPRRRPAEPALRAVDRYVGIDECFRNPTSPMDWH